MKAYKGSFESIFGGITLVDINKKTTGTKTVTLTPSAIGVTLVEKINNGGSSAGVGGNCLE
ncbi:MAG: hypothetical protein AB9891_16755 [Anaerolineaceae bacterium]